MNELKMRDEFKAWVLSEYPNQTMGQFTDGEYHSTTIQYCWLAWQASRESLVIELPMDIKTMAGPVMYAEDVRASCQAAGLKVKP